MTDTPKRPERFRPNAAVYLILQRDDEVLLLRRYNTGWQDGNYSLVSGHIDGNEPFSTAMIREAREEAGITVRADDLSFAHLQHRYDAQDHKEYVDVYFTARTWTGEVTNMEPEKCDELSWHHLDALPDNIAPGVKSALRHFAAGQTYFETGW